jgi:hypothetical protein
MVIKEYDQKYLEAVIDLFVEEYQVDREQYKENFMLFFEHPFQKEKCIRIIATNEEGELMGFQSFFYWPYTKEQKLYNVYQSGSSIVSKKARGKGVFQKMLQHMEVVREKYGIDFFIGFPVEASYKSFMSNGWDNPFDLHWYMKIKNPLGFLLSWLYPSKKHLTVSGPFNSKSFSLENSRDFMDWREGFQREKYRIFTFREGNHFFEVNHKVNKRKKIFNELIIGEVLCNTDDAQFMITAFDKYRRWLFYQWDISVISFCTNNENGFMAEKIIGCGLRRIDRKVYFITKYAGITKPEDWSLFRSDIDTW